MCARTADSILAAQLLQVSRYYSFFIVNMVAPIILTTMLGFFVFLLGVEDMEKRLGEQLPQELQRYFFSGSLPLKP